MVLAHLDIYLDMTPFCFGISDIGVTLLLVENVICLFLAVLSIH